VRVAEIHTLTIRPRSRNNFEVEKNVVYIVTWNSPSVVVGNSLFITSDPVGSTVASRSIIHPGSLDMIGPVIP
jgi:hypothetical protein